MEKIPSFQGRPTPKLFRWLRQQNPNPPLALQVSGQLRLGPADTLEAIHEYWSEIMCRDPQEREELVAWIDTNRPERMEESEESQRHREDMLYYVMQHTKPHTSPGMDSWPSEVLKHVPRRRWQL